MGIHIRQQKENWFVTVDEMWKLDSNEQFKKFYDFASKHNISFETSFGMEIIFVKIKKFEVKKDTVTGVKDLITEILGWKEACGDVL